MINKRVSNNFIGGYCFISLIRVHSRYYSHKHIEKDQFACCSFPLNFLILQEFFSKPLWDVIAYLVSNVPLPTPGKERVLFAIENCLLSVEAPLKDGLPHADV